MSSKKNEIVYAMTIAGLDPTGGAGATADLRVFKRLGLYGTSALTAITPQNTGGVKGIHPVEPAVLRKEIACILEDFPVAAAKTGQIPDLGQAKEIVRALKKHPIPFVVDPVITPTKGKDLTNDETTAYVKTKLLPLATIMTPNEAEASRLSGIAINKLDDMEEAAAALVPRYCRSVVITGGDGVKDSGDFVYDLFYNGEDFHWFKTARLEAGSIHGTGCHHSAALAGYLAMGHPLLDSVKKARTFITNMIRARLIDPTGKLKMVNS